MKRVRLSIVLGIAALTGIAIEAMILGYEPIAGVCAGGICSLLPKIVESEEHTINGQ